MTELTQEELNGLSPRARKALGADNMIQEIVEVNPNACKASLALSEGSLIERRKKFLRPVPAISGMLRIDFETTAKAAVTSSKLCPNAEARSAAFGSARERNFISAAEFMVAAASPFATLVAWSAERLN